MIWKKILHNVKYNSIINTLIFSFHKAASRRRGLFGPYNFKDINRFYAMIHATSPFIPLRQGGEGLKYASPGCSVTGVTHGNSEAWMFIVPHGPAYTMERREW